MNTRVRAFVDTNILKLTSEKPPLFSVPNGTDEAGQPRLRHFYSVYVPRPKKPVGEALAIEIEALRLLAEAAKRDDLDLLWTAEVHIEFMQLPESFALAPLLYGAPLKIAPLPLRYSRDISGPPWESLKDRHSWKRRTIAFMRGITAPRYRQLVFACGASQTGTASQNQLIDAFHVWSAERAEATHFLTCDFRLVNQLTRHKRYRPLTRIVRPSTLTKEMGKA